MSRARIAILVAFAATPIGLAACSSSSHQAAAPIVGKPGSSAAQSAAASTSAAAETTAQSASAQPANAGDSGDFCGLLAKNGSVLKELGASMSSPDSVDKDKLKQDLDAALAAAPAEIKSDLKVIVKFDEALLAGKPDTGDQSALNDSMQHYIAWINQHCAGGATS